MLTSDVTYTNGDAVASLKIAELPEHGTLELGNSPVVVGQEITVGNFDDLTYEPDDFFDQTDYFGVKLSSDGTTYDSANSLVSILVLGENDKPEIDAPSSIGVTEGETASGVGAAIVGSFDDPDTDDSLSEVEITGIPGATFGSVKYTSDSGSLITLTSVTSGSDPVAVLSASEAASLIFIANEDVVDESIDPVEVKIEYNVVDSEGESSAASGTLTIQINDGDDAPSLPVGTGPNDFKADYVMPENIVDVPHKLNPGADEETPNTLKYSISGTDASKLDVDSANGQLSFRSAPDYEDPDDSNKDNIYSFDYTVTDDAGQTATLAMKVTITDKEQGFSLTETAVTIDEGSTVAMTAVVEADDTSNDYTFSLADTGDSDLFEIDEDSGEVTFKSKPDAEDPLDGNTPTGVYDLEIIVTDSVELDGSSAHTDTIAVAITVEDIHDSAPALAGSTPITANSPLSGWTIDATEGELAITVAENTAVTSDTTLLTFRYDNGEKSSALVNEADLTFSLTSDAGTSNFEVSSTTVTNGVATVKLDVVEDAELDYESKDYDDGEFTLTLKVTDNDDGTTAATAISVELTDVNEKPYYEGDGPQSVGVDAGDSENIGMEIIDNLIDPEGEDLLFTFNNLQTTNTGELRYEKSGVVIVVDDGTGSSGTYTLTWNEVETLEFFAKDIADNDESDNLVLDIEYSVDDDITTNADAPLEDAVVPIAIDYE